MRRVFTVVSFLACASVARAQPALLDIQGIGVSNALRTFEPNGARHVARDRQGAVHVVFTDGLNVFYRRGRENNDGTVSFAQAVQLNDVATQIRVVQNAGLPASRGASMDLFDNGGGPVVVHAAWTVENRAVMYRRVEISNGTPSMGSIVNTGIEGHLPVVVVASDGRVHVIAEHAFLITTSEVRHATSIDGVGWTQTVVESAAATSSEEHRLACAAIDLRDRLHVIFQAQGYQNDGGALNATWWAARHHVWDRGAFASRPDPLNAFTAWGPPPEGRAVLFAYCNLAIDAAGSLHLGWHGTARSGEFALDDAFYTSSPYTSRTDSYGPWSTPIPLHLRVHDDVPGGPIEAGGDDDRFTWVPSMATDPATGELFAIIMIGPFDDEIGPQSTSAGTEVAIVSQSGGGQWNLNPINLSNSPNERNWFPNVAPRVHCTPAGDRVLDMLWVEGVHDPANVTAQNYDVEYARIGLGTGACQPRPDAGRDAGPDAGHDPGHDAGFGGADSSTVADGGGGNISDGGVAPTADAGASDASANTGMDTGNSDDEGAVDGGCSCRATPEPMQTGAFGFALLFFLFAVHRRRSRRFGVTGRSR